jgi:hypothetical protein
MAKREVDSRRAPVVPPVPGEKKEAAKTTGSARPAGAKMPSSEQLAKMSLPEIQKFVSEHGLMGYD